MICASRYTVVMFFINIFLSRVQKVFRQNKTIMVYRIHIHMYTHYKLVKRIADYFVSLHDRNIFKNMFKL